MRGLINLLEAASSITETPAFRRWFAGSKIVKQGKPVVVYHGTPTHGEFSNNRYVRSEQAGVAYPQFTEFNTEIGGITDSGWLGTGTYFTPDPDFAYEFGNFIIPCYLSIKNPFIIVDDHSMSIRNSLRFLQSLQTLKGLPDTFKLDLSLPPPTVYHSHYESRDIPIKYTVRPSGNRWVLVSGEHADEGVGVVEGEGETAEEAIFKYRYQHDDRFNGFLLSIIGRKLGADRFTSLLKQNGFDGVLQYHEWEDRHEMNEVVAFYPHQIKSIHNSAFDPNDPDFMR